jgi:hypothetical protein
MRRIYFFALCLFFVFLTPIIATTSLGGIPSRTYAEINKGELEKFEISVFSLEDKELDISISVGDIEELQVNIVPKEFELQGGLTSNPKGDYGWVILEGDKYAKLYPVYVYVRAPTKITKNHYSIPIIISAMEKSTEGDTEGVIQKVVQSLQYNLQVYVPGSITRIEDFVDLSDVNYTRSDYLPYKLPTVNPTSYYSPPEGGYYENVPNLVKENDSTDYTSADAEKVPTGYLFFNEEGEINWFIVFLVIIIITLLVFYLLEK